MSNGNNGGGNRPPNRPTAPPPPRLDDVRPSEHRTGSPGQARYATPPTGQPRRPAPQGHPHAGGGQHSPYPPRYAAPQRRPAPHKGQRSVVASIALYGVAGIAILAVVALAFLILAPPTDLIRQEAIAAVKRQTGRDLAIRGPARLTFYPSLGVSLSDVSLSQPPGMDGPPAVEMDRIDVAVDLLALVSRRVEVKKLVLNRPRFDLRIDAAGRTSWELASAEAERARVRLAEARLGGASSDAPPVGAIVLARTASVPGAPAEPAMRLDDLLLEDVRIVDGALTFTDERSNAVHRVASIDADVTTANIRSPLIARGDLDWQGETIAFDGSVSTVASVLKEKRARVVFEVKARPLVAKYDGTLDVSDGARLDGGVGASSPSVRALALWLGSTLPPSDGFGPLAINGRLKTSSGLVTLDDATISLDSIRATGSLAAATGGQRPHVKADLRVAELNLNPYLSGTGAPAPRTVAPAAASAPVAPAKHAEPRSIEDLLRDTTGPRVKGYTARSGWSDEPIDASLLRAVDADAKLSVGKLIVREITIGQSDVVVALKGGAGKATFERVSLYEGKGRGVVSLDASASTPRIGANLVIDGVAAAPLLKDAATIDWLSGTGRVTIAVTATGGTQRQLVGSLGGRVETAFADGAVKGFNVGKTMRGLGQGKLTGLSATPSEKTDFSELSATFDIVDGIATNQDLKLLSPLLRITGAGRIMMPDRQVDYVVRPKVVSELSGQGGNLDLGGIEVPVNITGSWDDPKFSPDLSKVNIGQASKAIEQIGKGLKGKSAGEIVDGLFGKDSKQGEQAKKLLEKLF